jgi:hypothetical protein
MLPRIQSLIEDIGLEGVGDRIFQTVAQEGSTKDAQGNQLDYVVWLLVTQNPNNNLSDVPDDDAQRVQIDYYGTNATRARSNMTQVRDAMEAVAYVIDGPVPDYEADTKLHRQRMDVAFITTRDYETED